MGATRRVLAARAPRPPQAVQKPPFVARTTPSTRRLLDTGFKSVKYGIFYKRGAELSDSQAATRLMIYVALGSMLLGVLLTVGLAGDAVWAARTATS